MSKVYIEQMECLVYSEKGIKVVNPSRFSEKLLFLEEQSALTPELEDLLNKLKKFGSLSFENKETIEGLIKKGFEFFVKNEKNEKEDEFRQIQFLLINILNSLEHFFTEGEDIINEHIWLLINKILHRP